MKIGIVGGGQLARMLALAGISLGFDFVFLVDKQESCVGHLGKTIIANGYQQSVLKDFASQVDVITYESENIPIEAMEILSQFQKFSPNIAALACAQDRTKELALLQSLNIPTAQTVDLAIYESLAALLADFKYPFILKRKLGGFDGRGQQIFTADKPLTPTIFAKEQALSVVQEMVSFVEEISCITVHDSKKNVVTYPLCLNQHEKGILNTTLAVLAHPLAKRAEEINRRIATELNYVGTLVVEYFVVDNSLMVNEIAPRVHNSGHWTIDASTTSQFENHLRAIADLPLGSTQLLNSVLMVNILGQWPNKAKLLEMPTLAVHDYQKTESPQRKIGHITVIMPEQIKKFISESASLNLPLSQPNAILKSLA